MLDRAREDQFTRLIGQRMAGTCRACLWHCFSPETNSSGHAIKSWGRFAIIGQDLARVAGRCPAANLLELSIPGS